MTRSPTAKTSDRVPPVPRTWGPGIHRMTFERQQTCGVVRPGESIDQPVLMPNRQRTRFGLRTSALSRRSISNIAGALGSISSCAGRRVGTECRPGDTGASITGGHTASGSRSAEPILLAPRGLRSIRYAAVLLPGFVAGLGGAFLLALPLPLAANSCVTFAAMASTLTL